jgi:hypothetical protein
MFDNNLLAQRQTGRIRVFGGDKVRFDATLDVPAGKLEIEMRLNWNEVRWIINKADFIDRYTKMIHRYWSGRYRLELVKTPAHGAPTVHAIKPAIRLVTTQNNPHYSMHVGYFRTGASFVQDDECHIVEDDVEAKNTSFAMNLGFKISHVNNAGWGYHKTVYKAAKERFRQVAGTIPFPAGQTGITPPIQGQLGPIVAQLVQDLPLFPLIPILIIGYRTAAEATSAGLTRATNVRDYLVNHRVPPSQLLVREELTSGTPGVELRLDKSFKEQFLSQPHSFPIAAHEFGHMLGLSDEYFAVNHPQNGPEAQAYVTYCTNKGITFAPFDANTISIMSMGYLVFPCHYAPFMQALEQILMEYYYHQSTAPQPGLSPGEKLARRQQVEAEFATYSVRINTTPLKNKPEESERISYRDWIAGLY